MRPSLTVAIPAFNEVEALRSFLPQVVSHCQERGYRLVVVDDGSRDGTDSLLDDAAEGGALEVLHHKVNRGYGAAIKTAFAAVATDAVITMDGDGQHDLQDVDRLYERFVAEDADLIIGSRRGQEPASLYRGFGKWIIRTFARLLMPLPVHDINSGMKIYRTGVARRYLPLCPDSMPFSDIMTLTFVFHRHRVLEEPIRVRERLGGSSTINTRTAMQTMLEILHILVLFNPLRVFLPLSFVCFLGGIAWGLPIVIAGRGVSVGALLMFTAGLLFFCLGLLAEQITVVRMSRAEAEGQGRVEMFCRESARKPDRGPE